MFNGKVPEDVTVKTEKYGVFAKAGYGIRLEDLPVERTLKGISASSADGMGITYRTDSEIGGVRVVLSEGNAYLTREEVREMGIRSRFEGHHKVVLLAAIGMDEEAVERWHDAIYNKLGIVPLETSGIPNQTTMNTRQRLGAFPENEIKRYRRDKCRIELPEEGDILNTIMIKEMFRRMKWL